MMMYKLRAPLIAAAFLASSGVLAVDDKTQKAEDHFNSGVAFFGNGEYADALIKFSASYKIMPHWQIRFNIGMCHYKLGNDLEAARELSSFIEEGGEDIPSKQYEQAAKFLSELEKKTGILMVYGLTEDAIVDIEGEEFRELENGKKIYLLPGEYHVVITAKNRVLVDKNETIKAGGIKEIYAAFIEMEIEKGDEEKPEDINGKKPKETHEKIKTIQEKTTLKAGKKKIIAAWATIGASGGLIIAGSVMGALLLNEKSKMRDVEDEYLSLHDEGASSAELEGLWNKRDSIYSKGMNFSIAADILLASGGVLAVTSLTLFLLSKKDKVKEKHSTDISCFMSRNGLFFTVKF